MFKAGVAARQETGSGWAGQTLFLQVNGNGLSVPIRQGIGVWAADCPVLRPHSVGPPRALSPGLPSVTQQAHSARGEHCPRGALPCAVGTAGGRDSEPLGGLQLQAGGWLPEWHTEQRCRPTPGWGGSTRTPAGDQELLLHLWPGRVAPSCPHKRASWPGGTPVPRALGPGRLSGNQAFHGDRPSRAWAVQSLRGSLPGVAIGATASFLGLSSGRRVPADAQPGRR